jgi:hypothetical protein
MSMTLLIDLHPIVACALIHLLVKVVMILFWMSKR